MRDQLLKHEIFFPLELNAVPGLVTVCNLDEHVEMESYIKQDNWSPPNGELCLKLKEDNDQEEVDQHNDSNDNLEVNSKREVLAVIEGCHQDKL